MAKSMINAYIFLSFVHHEEAPIWCREEDHLLRLEKPHTSGTPLLGVGEGTPPPCVGEGTSPPSMGKTMPLSLMWRRKPPPPLVVWEGTPPPCVEEGDVAARCGESDVVVADVEKVVMAAAWCRGRDVAAMCRRGDVAARWGCRCGASGGGAPHRIRLVLGSHCRRYCDLGGWRVKKKRGKWDI